MGSLVDRQSTERTQLHDFGELRIKAFQTFEGLIECQDGDLGRSWNILRFVNRGAGDSVAPLVGAVPAGVINEDSAHHLRGDAKEMSPAAPIDLTLVDQTQVHLVNKRRRFQGVVDPFAAKLAGSNVTKLRIDERQQLIERTLVAAT